LTALSSGAVEHVAWYDFRNDGANPFDHEQNFGAIRSDFRLKPAYRALATLTGVLEGKRVAERIEVGAGAYAFRFTSAGETASNQDAVVVCAPATARLLTFETSGEVTVVNGVGEAIEPLRVGNRCTITLDAEFPVYISGRRGFLFEPRDPPVTWKLESGATRAGQAARVTFTPSVEVERWEWPLDNAPPVRATDGSYRLSVPADAPPGTFHVQAIVRLGSLLRVPLTLRIQSSLLRV
jgi:hypothetical protein